MNKQKADIRPINTEDKPIVARGTVSWGDRQNGLRGVGNRGFWLWNE